MASNPTYLPSISLRDIDSVSEMHQVEALEQEIWGCEDLDVLPATMLSATTAVGGVLVGAYDDTTLVGFVYGFPGLEDDELIHHSHMLAVKRSHRNFDLGYRLKLAQRERVATQGIKRITWTFDPLQSLNAHFNFGKLGVVANKYKINFYGETTTSFLHQFGTDRLWVSWLIESERVNKRLQGEEYERSGRRTLPRLVRNLKDEPIPSETSAVLGNHYLAIEVPGDINALQQKNPELALRWRETTRQAFTDSMAAGYLVEDFFRETQDGRSLGVYILNKQAQLDDFRCSSTSKSPSSTNHS